MQRTMASALGTYPAQAAGDSSAVNLRCEYSTMPLDIDSPHPRLSWEMVSPTRGQKQTAYEILVASSPDVLKTDKGDLWDSGKVASDATAQIAYAGQPLASREPCFWKVRIWDRDGNPSPFSEPATWTMGLLNPSDWHGRWIADGAESPTPAATSVTAPPAGAGSQASDGGPAASTDQKPLPIFRKEFSVLKPLTRATIYICGLGQFELHLNGAQVGEDILSPGWTDYRKTCLYVTYDITSQLRQGPNALGVMLGNGMYNVPGSKTRYTKFTGSFGQPKLIAQLHLDYADGSSEVIATDDSWKTSAGPITFSSIYGGEDIDARLEQRDWDKPGFDDAAWSAAAIVDGPGGALAGSSRSAPAIRVAQVLRHISIMRPLPTVWVYDFGQNCAQIPKITLQGAAGAVVKLTPGEILNANGTVNQAITHNQVFYTYTLSGGDVPETWSPRFSYFGSRYLQVEGAYPAQKTPLNLPIALDLTGQFITSSSPEIGHFSCSNDLFNKTNDLVRWSMRNNMMSVLTDCPTREKLGWLEQDHLVGPSMLYNFDIARLQTKITGDISDSQRDNGMVPTTAPELTVFPGNFRDSPEWGAAAILIPWQMYQWFGDRQILADRYQTMKRYADFMGTKATPGIVNYGLGDWYDLGPKRPGQAQLTPVALTATAFYYRDLTIMSQAAKLLGHADDADHYQQIAASVRDAFNQKFYDPAKHSYATGSQTSLAIPLVMGIAPAGDAKAIGDALVAGIRANNNALTAGDIGYRYLLRALADGGHSDVIFDMNSRSDRPGYGMQLAKGATSLTEAWDAGTGASMDHFMLGHIMEWFYSDLAGIQLDPSAPGFKAIVIHPNVVGDITWAKADYHSIHGKISSSWKVADGKFSLEITIPANTTATIVLPTGNAKAVTESGSPASSADGVKLIDSADGASRFSVGSGNYHFESPLGK